VELESFDVVFGEGGCVSEEESWHSMILLCLEKNVSESSSIVFLFFHFANPNTNIFIYIPLK